jgi:hypothetical protein
MSDKKETPFETRCDILADLWMNYRKDSDFQDFLEYNDVGLPAAWLIAEYLCTPNEKLKGMIDETFILLLTALEIKEDTGFDSLEDLLVG